MFHFSVDYERVFTYFFYLLYRLFSERLSQSEGGVAHIRGTVNELSDGLRNALHKYGMYACKSTSLRCENVKIINTVKLTADLNI